MDDVISLLHLAEYYLRFYFQCFGFQLAVGNIIFGFMLRLR